MGELALRRLVSQHRQESPNGGRNRRNDGALERLRESRRGLPKRAATDKSPLPRIVVETLGDRSREALLQARRVDRERHRIARRQPDTREQMQEPDVARSLRDGRDQFRRHRCQDARHRAYGRNLRYAVSERARSAGASAPSASAAASTLASDVP
jgi:hypothetical protein